MSFAKPFHRNYREMNGAGSNSGYSRWAYIIDPEYAKEPEHYVRALLLIQKDLGEIFEYVEPSDECSSAFSYRIHALLMRACIEVEANFKAIFEENTYSRAGRSLKMTDYRKVEVTHHLSGYEVMLPIWNGGGAPILRPFGCWAGLRSGSRYDVSPAWYQAYNASKHNRHEDFKKASLGNLVMAVAGLLVLVSAQFQGEEFSAGSRLLSAEGYEYYPMEAAIGSMFRIRFPDDWDDSEIYDFNWSELKLEQERFAKIDYDAITV